MSSLEIFANTLAKLIHCMRGSKIEGSLYPVKLPKTNLKKIKIHDKKNSFINLQNLNVAIKKLKVVVPVKHIIKTIRYL